MPTTRNRGWVRRATAAAGAGALSLLLSFLLMEGAVRLLGLFADERASVASAAAPITGDEGEAGAAQRYRLHPYRGWSRVAGVPGGEDHITAHTLRQGEDREVSSNLLGYYSPVRDYRALDDDDFVIGIFGGSVAGGYGTLGVRPLVEEVVRERPELAGRVRVLNFGMGQYKQPQQLAALLEAVALGVPLDVVVNLDGFNEIHVGGRDAKAGRHPLYPSHNRMKAFSEWGGGAPSADFVLASARILEQRRRAERLRALGAEGSGLGRSELARALLGVAAGIQMRRSIVAEEQLQAALQAQPGSGALAELPDDCLGRESACWALIADIWERASAMMAGVAASADARYLHVLQPNQYVEGSKPLSDEERASAFDETTPIARRVRAAYDVLRERGPALRARGVDFVDATRVFEGHGETLYVDRCCHFNQRGYRILSRLLAERIAGPAPSETAPDTAAPPTPPVR